MTDMILYVNYTNDISPTETTSWTDVKSLFE